MNINTKKMQVFKRQEGVPLNPEKIKQTFFIWPLILGDLSKLGRFIKKKTFFGQQHIGQYVVDVNKFQSIRKYQQIGTSITFWYMALL